MALKQLGATPLPARPSDVITEAQLSALSALLGSMPSAGVFTTSFTATANDLHVLNFAASLGAVAITLPAAPPQGTVCAFARLDNNGFTSLANITPGGSDFIAGLGASPYNFPAASATVALIYANGNWYVKSAGFVQTAGAFGPTPSAVFNPSLMLRDNFGRAQVVDPAVAGDISTKNYVDLADAAANNAMPVTRLLTR